jgi:predicted TPR repeat methyltransferase
MPNDINTILADFNQQLKRDPHNPQLYSNIANLYYKTNQIDRAIYYYKRSLSITPDNWQTHSKLGNCYVKKNLIDDAMAHYKYSIELNPDNINATQNLGMLFVGSKEFTEALPYLEKSYHFNPTNKQHFEFIEQLANCYLQVGNIAQAIDYLKIAIELNPNQESAQHNLAILYLRQKNHALAIQHFKKTLAINPNNQTAKHMLLSLTQNDNSNKTNLYQPPTEYVENLFDQYASYYNQHVTKKLSYHLPEKLRSLYAKYNTAVTAKNTLDLGCGTGLCGVYFRDATINLIGVDISKNMLLEAGKNNFYDLLIQSDLKSIDIFQKNYFDLIIAADVFPYLGSLDNFFFNLTNILKHNNNPNHKSLFLFNIESKDPSNCNKNFSITSTGRCSHSVDYIQQLAKEFNLEITEKIKSPIRHQEGIPVMGDIFVLAV